MYSAGPPRQHPFGEKFEIDLMNNACRRWHRTEILESRLAPPDKLVPFAVALKFDVGVDAERLG